MRKPPPQEQDAYEYMPPWLLEQMPELYSTEGQDDPTLYTKYLSPEGRWTFYAIEYSDRAPDGTPGLFFGYLLSPLGPDWDELWYLSLREIERLRSPRLKLPVERDLWFEPRPLSDVREE